MIIGVVSDTHISNKNEEIPQAIARALKNVDLVIHAGDFTDLSVLDKLNEVCKEVVAVCGNMDNISAKARLPQKKIIQAGSYRIGVMHGFGHPGGLIDLLAKEFKDDKVDIIIFGHSHCAYNKRHKGILFFNPGSPTDKLFATSNSYGIIEIKDKIEARIVKI
ncbi:MAG: metallophosphoesterase family protein [Candidatus Omnitrophota bacterium]|nr:metallophosphoesterase [Candidatus Omnitrophota bacterium]